MKKWRNSVLLLSIIISIVVVLSIHQAKAKQEIGIGVICDLTGVIAEYGTWVQNGVIIASEIINENDPFINFYFEDGQSNVNKALGAFERFSSINNIHLIICGCNSSSIMSLSPKADSTKTILFSTIASSPNMKETGEFVFSDRVLGTEETECVANNLEQLGIKSIAIIAHNNEAGMPYIDAFSNASKGKDINIVSKILVEPTSKDFRTELIKLKSLNPDAVLLVTPVEQTLNFIKQAKDISFTSKWLGISTLKTDGFIKNGGNLVENVIIASESVEYTRSFIDFQIRYQRRFNEKPTVYAVNGYEAAMIFYALIKKYGNNVSEIQKALYSEEFQTLFGKVFYDKNGIIQNKKVDLYEIRKGEFVKKE